MLDLLRSVYERLTAGGSTAEQAVQSGIWVATINVGDRVLQLLKVVILARLLSPEAFGLLGIALLAIAALRQFSKLGFDEALIQHEEDDVDEYLNTAWVLKIIRGSVIALTAFLAAPRLAIFFGEAQAGPLIRVIGFSPLILGLQNPAVMYFQKNLNFHREFFYQVGGRFIDLTVAVTIAFVFRSVWALAIGIVSMNLVKFVLSYVIHEYRPSIEFNLEFGKEMFGFGKWMFASSILVFLYNQGDDAFVGWFFTAASLGFYQLAYRFSNAPATEVTHVISRVAFPAFSKVQDDTKSLRTGYYRVLKLTSLIGFPMAAGIIAVAPQFVNAVLGNQWGPMIPLMQVLSLWGGLRAIGANFGAVFNAVGRPDYNTKLQALKALLVVILIYPAANNFGILGVAAIIVGNTLVVQPIAFYFALDIIDGRATDVIHIILYPLICSAAMAGLVLLADRTLVGAPSMLNLVLLIATGVAIYVSAMLIVEEVTSYGVTSIYANLRNSI
ncbi:lipopolysaccharide biosynthesis protein [Halobacterium hubeiense]|uniref:lipopolysaccharide biosynthesis protein n=1 Tax=Halobacterium hubeiense TaxID=1407499 RepID=UPI000B7C9FFF|nr:lipopolysaccharide biosynthesis protein [Halobacterium hubeiense]